MATTYTPNYNLGKQEDYSDKFDMSVITDDMDIIDAQMKANADAAAAVTPTVESSTIDNTALASFYSGIKAGELAAEITGSSAEYGIVRAYMLSETESMQIAEAVDGTRKTRYYTSSAWSSWV
jgi:hypothetical protein